MKILENKFFQFLIFVLMIVIIFYFATMINEKSQADNNVITVTGEGEIYAKPDVGVIDISVKTENKDVSKASDENNLKMNDIIDMIKSQEVEEKDIKTSGYNINPIYQWEDKTGKRSLTGYEVTQSINVKIRDLSKVGNIISQATEKGANSVGNLYFIIDNDDQLKADAKKLAIEDAKKKAKELERTLGVRMVRIVNFSDNTYNPTYSSYDYGYSGAIKLESSVAAPTISTGQNKITSTVVITYAIQ